MGKRGTGDEDQHRWGKFAMITQDIEVNLWMILPNLWMIYMDVYG